MKKRTKKWRGKASISNKKSQWKLYHTMKRKISAAYNILVRDFFRQVMPSKLIADAKKLNLLLGEVNWIAKGLGKAHKKKKMRTHKRRRKAA